MFVIIVLQTLLHKLYVLASMIYLLTIFHIPSSGMYKARAPDDPQY